MVSVRTPEQALLYHFTHIDNLPSILGSGGLVADRNAPAAGLATDVGELSGRRRGEPTGTSEENSWPPATRVLLEPIVEGDD